MPAPSKYESVQYVPEVARVRMKNIYKIKFMTKVAVVEAVVIVRAANLERFVEVMILQSKFKQFLNRSLEPMTFKDVECEVIGTAEDDASDRIVLITTT